MPVFTPVMAVPGLPVLMPPGVPSIHLTQGAVVWAGWASVFTFAIVSAASEFMFLALMIEAHCAFANFPCLRSLRRARTPPVLCLFGAGSKPSRTMPDYPAKSRVSPTRPIAPLDKQPTYTMSPFPRIGWHSSSSWPWCGD